MTAVSCERAFQAGIRLHLAHQTIACTRLDSRKVRIFHIDGNSQVYVHPSGTVWMHPRPHQLKNTVFFLLLHAVLQRILLLIYLLVQRFCVLIDLVAPVAAQFKSAGSLQRPVSAMGKEPGNIKRLKKDNDMYAAAEHHARDIQVANVKAQWFSDGTTASTHGLLANLYSDDSCLMQQGKTGIKDQMVQELTAANQVLRMQRQAQLRDLLARERVQHEKELNSLGLAFEKHRD